MADGIVRVAAIGDLHCTKSSQGAFQPLFAQISESADVLLIGRRPHRLRSAGGSAVLARELTRAAHSGAAVLGNHDFESGKDDEVRQILADAGVVDPRRRRVRDAGHRLRRREGIRRRFRPARARPVGRDDHQAVRARGGRRGAEARGGAGAAAHPQLVALLHYSPIQRTVEGEPLEIFPFLGSSRLEEPIGRYPVSLVFHGHAHRGSPKADQDGRAGLQRRRCRC